MFVSPKNTSYLRLSVRQAPTMLRRCGLVTQLLVFWAKNAQTRGGRLAPFATGLFKSHRKTARVGGPLRHGVSPLARAGGSYGKTQERSEKAGEENSHHIMG